jgi:phosphoglycolate phosphatase
MSFPLLVLDLDGTLVDSLPDLTSALNRLLGAHGLAGLTTADVRPMVGDGTAKLVERALAARGRISGPDDVSAFVADYTAHAAVETQAYSGVEETLGTLRAKGWRFAICTNKPEAAAKSLLASLGLASWFAAVGGGDSFAVRKTDPGHLLATIKVAGGNPSRAVMAGDHANDIAAAKAAALPAIFAAWGYGYEPPGLDPKTVARRFTDLAVIAPRLVS